MLDVVSSIDGVIAAVTRLRTTLHKATNRQVRSSDERALVKATAHAWFKNYRASLANLQSDPTFKAIDQGFAMLLEWADQNITRAKYRDLLQAVKNDLIRLRSGGVLVGPVVEPQRPQFGVLKSVTKDSDKCG